MNRFNETLNKYVCNKERVKEKVYNKMKNKNKKYIGISIAFASLILLFAGSLISYNIPTSYVSIDINPSVMLSTNFLDKVVKVEALNDDAKEVVDNLDLYGKNATDAVNEVVDNATTLGYIDENASDNVILVSTYCDNIEKREELQENIHNNLNQNLNKNGIRSLIIDSQLTTEDAQQANEYGVSEAKILFVKKAIEQNPELKFEDLIYLPAKEIAKYIDGYEELNSTNNGNYQNNKPNNNGNGHNQNRNN